MITIIDYNTGNIASVQNMLKKIGQESVVTSDKKLINEAKKIILPGVGAFDYGMKNLHDLDLVECIRKKALQDETPILGICLGMQLLGNSSEEGTLEGLKLINCSTKKFMIQDECKLKIPHMGWNYVDVVKRKSTLFRNLSDEARFYFVHSYYVEAPKENILTTTDYGFKFASSINSRNINGVQFHPEKSHKYGMKLLNNFAEVI